MARVFVVFLAHLARATPAEAQALAEALGAAEYDIRLALAVPPPAIVEHASDRDRASRTAALLRARGHEALVFDHASFVSSASMSAMDHFVFETDGVRASNGELLPFDDVFAVLRAVHETRGPSRERPAPTTMLGTLAQPTRVRLGLTEPPSKTAEREHVAYFFRRSGERPWILRERHAHFGGLGSELELTTFANFMRTVARVRASARMAVADDRLLRRRVADRMIGNSEIRSSEEGVDLLAHLLASMIANQAGSPYR